MQQTVQIDRRHFLGGAIIGSAALALPSSAWALVREAQAYPALRAFVNGFVERGQLPGTLATVGKAFAAPEVIAAGTQAVDGKRSVDIDSLWRIYSMTKPVTGIATMMLIEDGKLGLDQPLADILPAFADMKVLKNPNGALSDTVTARTPITIRQLLTHSAGIGYAISQSGPIKQAYNRYGLIAALVSRIKIPGINDADPAPDLKSFADRLATLPLVYEPGTQYSYSAGFDLLGRVIEVASGMAFDQFLSKRLFVPLQMKSTFFRVPQSQVGRMTTSYSPIGPMLMPVDPGSASIFLDAPGFLSGGGGLISSGRDYDRFLMMLLGQGAIGDVRVMKPDTAKLAISNLLPAGVVTQGTYIDGQGFGAGGRVTLPGSATGEGVFGWAGAAGTVGWVDTKRSMRVAGYAQYLPPDALDFQSGFVREFAKDLM